MIFSLKANNKFLEGFLCLLSYNTSFLAIMKAFKEAILT